MPAFDVLVVGAGLVGLATSIGLAKRGHTVRVVEASPGLQTVGDAIAVAANQQRVLEHFGILEDFQARAVKDLGFMYHRRYETGEVVSTRDMKTQEANYGHASYILSRAGYQQFLYDQALKLGINIQFDSRVENVEDHPDRPALKLKNGQRLEADIIVGADGVKSAIRGHLFPSTQLDSQWNCYRATIPHTTLSTDPSLVPFLTGIHFNMGPNLMVIQSNMADIGVVSLNLYHSGETGSAGAWKAPGDLKQMKRIFGQFYPEMQAMLDHVDECIVWKVVEVTGLEEWVSKGGKVVLVGDAAHGMNPFQGQGCSTGVEDAGVLAECLSRAASINEVPALLNKYQEFRKPRTDIIQAASKILGQIWSMPDGELQSGRDEMMGKTPMYSKGDWDGKAIDELPSGLRDPKYSPWLMGHDAVDFAKRKLDAVQ